MTVVLQRFAYDIDGTFGRLTVGDLSLFTVERPWLDNRARESCIPEGVYPLSPRRYHKGGYNSYEIMNVPDRSLILIHIANIMDDVLGCVGVGGALGIIGGKLAVTGSRDAFGVFIHAMKRETGPHSIEITFDRTQGIVQ